MTDTIILRDTTTGAGRTGLTVKLHNWSGSAWVEAYSGVEISGKPGVYSFTNVQYNLYKLYVNASEESSWGGDDGKFFGSYGTFPVSKIPPLVPASNIGSGNISNAELEYLDNVSSPIQAQLDSKLPKSGGSMTGLLNMGSNKVQLYTDPSDPNSAVNIYTLFLSALLRTGGTMAGAIDMGGFRINNLPDPVSNLQPVNLQYMVAYINAYLTGTISAFQESANVVRIVYSGTQEDGRVYRTLSAGLTYAATQAASGRHITMQITGNGNSSSLLTNHNLFSASDVHLYCHIMGFNPDTLILIGDDAYQVGTVAGDLGKVILKNLHISLPGDSASPSFTRFVFDDCKINANDNALSLVDCEFRGLNTIKAGSLSIEDTIGTTYWTNVAPSETGTNPPYVLSTNF